jgi:hypothetical protein
MKEYNNIRSDVLMQALNLINGDREKDYGTPKENFNTIAEMWTSYILIPAQMQRVMLH